MDYKQLVDKAYEKHNLEKEEIERLLMPENSEDEAYLFKRADQLRHETVGDFVHLRGLIEFSSHCRRNCNYCGLRRDNTSLLRYRLSPDEIVDIAHNAAMLGYKTIVLQSGEDEFYTADIISDIIRRIKQNDDVAVTLCIGERSYEEYKLMRQAGADRYLLKFETANPEHYAAMHPDMNYDDRIKCLMMLKDLGYEVGSGNIVGLPGQTIAHLAEDIMLLKELDVEMAGIGPFIPHGNTPFRGEAMGTLEMTLRVVAIVRLMLPYANIPATTAVGTIHPQGRQKALMAGANVVMPNVMPSQYRPRYEIYPSKICIGEQPANCRMCIEGIIRSLGREVGTDYGSYKAGQ